MSLLGRFINILLAPFDLAIRRKSKLEAALASVHQPKPPPVDLFPSVNLSSPYAQPCYAQEGEDMILRRFFEQRRQENGFFVDVGAHHPMRFSNTFLFYQRGWRGINIEPTPGSKTLFEESRPEDITLECAVGKPETLVFHIFNEGALNRFSAARAEEISTATPQYQVVQRIPVEKIPLASILDTYLPVGKTIDFLTIDAEDVDLEVAQSNNWEKYRPTVVLIENHEYKGVKGQAPIRNFMDSQGYRLAFRTVNTDFYLENDIILNKSFSTDTHYDEEYFKWQSPIGKFGGWANLIKFESHISPDDIVLDFGSGGGYLLSNIKCFDKCGIEINDAARDFALQHNNVMSYKYVSQVKDNYFSIIISNHALEHCDNPFDVLKNLYNKLRNNGKIIFVVPCERYDCQYDPHDINKHLYTWNPMTLGNLFTHAGFIVDEVKPFLHKWPPNYEEIVAKQGKDAFHQAAFQYGKEHTELVQIKIIAHK